MRNELPNAYGPMVHDGVEYERTSGWFNIWPQKDGDDTFHMFDFSDGCHRAGLPVCLETLKGMRDKIAAYITEAEKPESA